jgi:hypothetical protein
MPTDEYGKQAVIEILMRRDNMTREDATQLVREFEAELKEMAESATSVTDPSLSEIEDLFTDYFGLEPDYLFSFLNDLC